MLSLIILSYYETSKKKSVTRTIRISRDLDDLLEKDAENKRITVNSLISSIITKYAEWDRLVEFIGYVSLPHDELKFLLDSLEDAKIREIGQMIGSKHLQKFMIIWHKEISMDSFFKSLGLFCRYGGMAKQDTQTKDGKNYVIAIHHDLGKKWSKCMQYVIEEGMKSTFNIIPRIEITDSTVMFRFQVPYR